MNGIIGMTELALDTTLTAGQREYLETVKSCADSLLTLINDILDFSKIEAGKLSLDEVPFNVRDVLDDTIKTLGLRAHQKGLELACHVLPDVPAELVGDPGRLRQIVINLVGNAIKFTEQGEVVVRVQTASRRPPTRCACISPSPIPASAFPPRSNGSSFKPSSRPTNRRRRLYGGTGLGLAIVSKLVAMMGGEIWVESELGTAARFTLRRASACRRNRRQRGAACPKSGTICPC